jgi:DNA primase
MEKIMPSIKQSTIEKIKELSITDEISRHIVLKRGKGLCPFHEDKTPSFSVNDSKGFYHCFSCGASGDIIKFVQEYHKKTFVEAIEYLADANNISVEYTKYSGSQNDYEKVKKEKNDLYDVYQAALKFYRSRFQQSSKAKQYLADRKISDKTINQFQLGFAPGDWKDRMHLKRHLLEKGYSEHLLATAKLVKQDGYSKGEFVDFFFDRLIIPILDTSDRVIAFGGRAFGDIKPKYINSEESPIFSKRNTLFALNFAKSAIQKQDQAILVEGYFDVIALHQAGINTAIASLGTALTPEQVKLVCRYTASNKILLGLDADQAGQNAVIKIDKTGVDSTRGILLQNKTEIFSGNLQFYVLSLPHPYKDPDEYLRENPAKKYQALIDSAPDAISWGIYQICKKASDYKQAVKTILTFLTPLESETLTQQYLQEAAYQLSLRSQSDQQSIQKALFTDFRRLRRVPKVKNKQEPKVSTPVSKNSRLKQAERLIVLFYIYMGENVKNYILDTQEEKDVFLNDNECVALWSAAIHAEHKMQPDETLLSILSQQNVKIELSETEELDLKVDGERAKKILDECFDLLSQHKEEQMLKALLNSQYFQQDQIDPVILQQIERMKQQVMQKQAG